MIRFRISGWFGFSNSFLQYFDTAYIFHSRFTLQWSWVRWENEKCCLLAKCLALLDLYTTNVSRKPTMPLCHYSRNNKIKKSFLVREGSCWKRQRKVINEIMGRALLSETSERELVEKSVGRHAVAESYCAATGFKQTHSIDAFYIGYHLRGERQCYSKIFHCIILLHETWSET